MTDNETLFDEFQPAAETVSLAIDKTLHRRLKQKALDAGITLREAAERILWPACPRPAVNPQPAALAAVA